MADLLNGMVEAALCAGEVILDVYEGDFDFEVKGDSSPVTKADKAAEAVILEHLARLEPNIAVVAEEAVSEGEAPKIGDRFFLVDPVDGTKEFIRKNGEFTVNIALIENGIAVSGVVYAPAKGWLYVGQTQGGAFKAFVADPRISHKFDDKRVIKMRQPDDQICVVGSRSHHTPEADEYLSSFDVKEQKSIGSSLKFCLLAEGEADLYPRFGRTMEWDTAAGDAVVCAAGGQVSTLNGERLQYGKIEQDDAPFANPFFIVKKA